MPDLDRSNARSQRGEQTRQSLVLAAVVGDLQRLHGRERQRREHVGLRVGGQQQVELADGDLGDHRALVRIASGRQPAGGVGGQSTRTRIPPRTRR